MKWYDIKKHKPPMGILCAIFTENNYFYLAKLIDSEHSSRWLTENYCNECANETSDIIYGVTHFCIFEPVPIQE